MRKRLANGSGVEDPQEIPFEQVCVLLPSIEHKMHDLAQSYFEEEGEKKHYVTYGFQDDYENRGVFSQVVINWLKKIEDDGVAKAIWRRLPEISVVWSVAGAKKIVKFLCRVYCTGDDGKEIKLSFIKPEGEVEATNG